MKILLVTGIYPPDIGGPATYTRTIARALSALGHDVRVIAYVSGPSTETEDEECGFRVTRVSRDQSRRDRYAEYEEKTYQIAKDRDIVYLQGPVSEGYPGTRAAERAGKPTVMKIVGDYAWEMYMQGGNSRNRELLDAFAAHRHWWLPRIFAIERTERWSAKRAKKIIVPSKYLKQIVEQWGVPADAIDVIYNSVEPPDAGLTRDEARKAFGVEGNRVLFTAVRAVPWKNADFIISLLSDLDRDIVFAIAGEGPSLDAWKAEAKRLGVEDRVKFLGKLNREQMGSWYRAADLFVLPSGYEGYPNVIPEAWSQGLPCFVSDKGGNTELHLMLTHEKGEKPDISQTDFLRILPYLDRDQWLQALSGSWPNRFERLSNYEVFNKNAMIAKTASILNASANV